MRSVALLTTLLFWIPCQLIHGQTIHPLKHGLQHWFYDSTYWKFEDGVLTGEVTPSTILRQNSFAIWLGTMPSDFELTVEYFVSSKGNSGINYRSKRVPNNPYSLMGYQADIDGEGLWNGQNYEERGREFLALRGQKTWIDTLGQVDKQTFAKSDSLQQLIRKEEWNVYRLRVVGNRMQHYINGILMSEVVDNDKHAASKDGFFGVQVHVGPPMVIRYRKLKIRAIRP